MKHCNESTTQSLNVFYGKCKDHDLKITPQRMAIFKELINSQEHPTADQLHKKLRKLFPSISLDTVNRTLLTFADVGIANIVEGSGEPRRFDPDINNHHHFRCVRCGKIADIHTNIYDDLEIPDELLLVVVIKRTKVVLEGYCENCK